MQSTKRIFRSISSAMGSALSTAPVMPEQAVHDLHREDQMLQARSMCGSGGLQSTRQRTEEERDASIICHVHHALRHYNATNNEGLEFVPVKPLMAAYVGFRSHIWVHVSFLARRRKITSSKQRRRGKDSNDHLKHFFAELRYDHHFGTPTVETCTTIDNLTRKSHMNTSCAFCPKSFEILHPLDGNFVCGKKSQEDEEQGFSRFMNLLEKPYTCPSSASSEAKEDAATPKEERRSIRSWTLLPFNFATGFLWVFEAKLKAWMSGDANQEANVMSSC